MVVIWLKTAGFSELQARLEQLGPDHEREQAADQEHQQREHQVHRPDVLVVRRRQPAHDALRRSVRVVVVVAGVCHRVHSVAASAGAAAVFCSFEPGVELCLRLRDDDDRHEAMVGAAEFRALAAVGAGLVRVHRDPHLVDEARDRVALHAEVRHPPGVDDVIRRQQHADLDAGRDHERLVDVEQVVLDGPRVDAGTLLAGHVARAREPAVERHAACRGTRTASTTGGR